MNRSIIRNRSNKEEQKAYLFKARKSFWKEVEDTADALDVSVAHLIRESVRRNIAAYKKASLL